MQKGAGKALGSVIVEGDFQPAFLGCSKFFFYGRDGLKFLKVLRRWWWRLDHLLKYCITSSSDT